MRVYTYDPNHDNSAERLAFVEQAFADGLEVYSASKNVHTKLEITFYAIRSNEEIPDGASEIYDTNPQQTRTKGRADEMTLTSNPKDDKVIADGYAALSGRSETPRLKALLVGWEIAQGRWGHDLDLAKEATSWSGKAAHVAELQSRYDEATNRIAEIKSEIAEA